MKWNIARSEEIKKQIVAKEDLMRKLSDCIETTLKKHKIALGRMGYVFEPRVFTMTAEEAPEIALKAHDAMVEALITDLHKKGMLPNVAEWAIEKIIPRRCLPMCGIVDPGSMRILEKYRVIDKLAVEPSMCKDDPVPVGERFMTHIVGNKELLTELSQTIFSILGEAGIKLGANEGCVFAPMLFEKPVYAQKIPLPAGTQLSGFTPEIFADPTPEPAILRWRPFPGIIQIPRIPPIPGVIIDRFWWWIGIPAPEMLRALDLLRNA